MQKVPVAEQHMARSTAVGPYSIPASCWFPVNPTALKWTIHLLSRPVRSRAPNTKKGNRCLPRVEESFVRIVADNGAALWYAWDKSGLKYAFGEPNTASVDGCVRTEMRYDQYGNITQVTDALGRTTLTDYDATRIHPRRIRQAELRDWQRAYRLAVDREYDPGCGKLLSESVLYNHRGSEPSPAPQKARRAYDNCRRLSATARPGPNDNVLTSPYQSFVYLLGGPRRPTVLATYTKDPAHDLGKILSTTLIDGMGRTIQQKSETVVDAEVVAATTATYHDALGRVVKRFAPYATPRLAMASYSAPPADAGVTTLGYDAAGRLTATTAPDGKVSESVHAVAWETTTRDACYVDPNCTGRMVTEKRDALGRTVEKLLYEEPNTLKAGTKYTYDELGRLIETMQWNGRGWNVNTKIRIADDTLGRKVSMTDPDSGYWEYHYDLAGNLIYQNDPRPLQSPGVLLRCDEADFAQVLHGGQLLHPAARGVRIDECRDGERDCLPARRCTGRGGEVAPGDRPQRLHRVCGLRRSRQSAFGDSFNR